MSLMLSAGPCNHMSLCDSVCLLFLKMTKLLLSLSYGCWTLLTRYQYTQLIALRGKPMQCSHTQSQLVYMTVPFLLFSLVFLSGESNVSRCSGHAVPSRGAVWPTGLLWPTGLQQQLTTKLCERMFSAKLFNRES